MANILRVTLDKSTIPPTVHVENTEVRRGRLPRFIVWHLEGNARKGEFAGFRWSIPPPPPGIFGRFTSIPRSRWAVIPDLHTGARTKGVWVYRLAVRIGRKTYSTKRLVSAKRKSAKRRSGSYNIPMMLMLPTSGTPNIKNK